MILDLPFWDFEASATTPSVISALSSTFTLFESKDVEKVFSCKCHYRTDTRPESLRKKKLNRTEQGERDWRKLTFFGSTQIRLTISPDFQSQNITKTVVGTKRRPTMQTLHRPTCPTFHSSSRLFSKILVYFKLDFILQNRICIQVRCPNDQDVVSKNLVSQG